MPRYSQTGDNRSGVLERWQTDWENPEDVLRFIEQRWENRDFYKLNLENRWIETISCYEGYYNTSFTKDFRRIVQEDKIPPWRVNLLINLALPIVRSGAAKHLRNRPIWDVIPASASVRDVNIASGGKKCLRGYWYQQGLDYAFIDLMLWLGLTGNAFAYCCWNPDKGPKVELSQKDFLDQAAINLPQPNPGDEMMSAVYEQKITKAFLEAQQRFKQFLQVNKSNELALGDVQVTIPTPFDLLFPFANNFYEVPWLIESQVREISYYADLGIDVEQLTEPSDKDSRYIWYLRKLNTLQTIGFTGTTTNTHCQDERQILELKLWIPPFKGYPKGITAVAAGGKIVSLGTNPYDHRRLPYVHFGSEKTPGKIWCGARVEQAIPLIRSYQKTRSQIIENKNMVARPKILAPRTARLLGTAFTSEPGEVVEYSGTLPPTPWTPPPTPRYVFDSLSLDRRDIDDIVAQREATRGINPSGVRSAVALENLQSQDEGELAIVGLNIDTGMSLLGRLILSTLNQFSSEDRLYAYTGEKNRYEAYTLKAGALKGDTEGGDYFNVRITQFSQFGLTRVGQLEFLKVLLQYNVFQSNERPKIMKFIQMGFFEDEIDEFKKHRSNAYKENQMMAAGQQVVVSIGDHDQTHLEEHYEFIIDDTFKMLPPQLQAQFFQHIQSHQLEQQIKLVTPQILQMKAQFIVAQQQGMLQFMLQGAMANANGSRNSSSGSSQSSGSGSSQESSGSSGG